MPGSAVMFIALEGETDIANLVVWPALFDRQRKIILGAQMMACLGTVQSVSSVVHLVDEYLIDQPELLPNEIPYFGLRQQCRGNF